MNKRNKTRFCLVIVLCLLMGTVLGACSIGGGGSSNSNNAAPAENNSADEQPQEEMFEISMSDLMKNANKSSGLWEMMCNLFPDKIVHKSSGAGFTLAEVDKSLPQNKYDWTDLSKALKGIDVSAYQKTIDWKAVKESGKVDFAFLRVGYRGWGTGRMELDSKFAYNAKNALENGIPIGVYFVTKAITPEEAKEEAEWIIQQIKGYKVTWPVVMDFESAQDDRDRTWGMTSDTRTEIIISFCETLKAAGYTPMLYGAVGTYMAKMDIARVSEYCKWFAQYFNAPHFAYAFQIWQATGSGTVEGIPVNVDIDYSMFDFGTGLDAADSGKGAQRTDNSGDIDNSTQPHEAAN